MKRQVLMAYRILFLLLLFPLHIYAQTLDGIEFRSDKKNIEILPFGNKVAFPKTDLLSVELDPHFHNHDGIMKLDTMILFIAPWVNDYHGLEIGIQNLKIQGKNFHKMERFTVLCGDPVSPKAGSDTFAVNIQITYQGKAKINKKIPISLHLNGSNVEGMAWGYLSALISTEANKSECITEVAPKEVEDFMDGFIQEINFYGSLPYKFTTSYNKTARKMCVFSGPKISQKAQWELRHIIVRGL